MKLISSIAAIVLSAGLTQGALAQSKPDRAGRNRRRRLAGRRL